MKVDIVRDLKRELEELQPAIEALDREPDLMAALQAAAQAEVDYRNSPEQPTHSALADQRQIELNGITNRARDELNRVKSEGAEARRRAKQITALLGASDEIAKIDARAAAVRIAIKAAKDKLDRSAALAEEIRNEIAALEAERTAAIDRGAEDRLEGRADTSSKIVSRIDSELPIRRAALTGAERAQAKAAKELEVLPPELTELEGRRRAALSMRGELEKLQFFADPDLMRRVARVLAAKAMNFAGTDRLELRPPREMLDEEIAKLNAEMRGVVEA